MKLTHNRKAISPVLATVILIAITLIAAIVIAGFVFGLFGTFTAGARISANAVSCQSKATNGTLAYCIVSLTNNGNAGATIQACSFTGSGGGTGALHYKSATGGASLAAGLVAGGTITYGCAAPATLASGPGTSVSGSVSLSNGGSAFFTAGLT